MRKLNGSSLAFLATTAAAELSSTVPMSFLKTVGLGDKPPQPIAAKSVAQAAAQDRAGEPFFGAMNEAKIKRATTAGEQTTDIGAEHGFENGLTEHMALHSGRTHNLRATTLAHSALRTPATVHA